MDTLYEFAREKILPEKTVYSSAEYAKMYRDFHSKIINNIPFFIYGICNNEKEQIAHEITTKILLNIERIDFANNVNGYIYAVTKYYCIDRKRALKKQPAITVFSNENVNSFIEENTPLKILNDKENKLIISGLISKLPCLKRDLVTDKYLNELSVKEIAEKYQLTAKHVENQLYNSLKKLKMILKS